MDYEETLLQLDSIVGTWAVVYPAGDPTEQGEETRAFAGGGLFVAGWFKRDRAGEQGSAAARRVMMENIPTYRELRPELDLGDTPLEQYERQTAHFTFEGMDDLGADGRASGFAGFSLWRHDFVESRWLSIDVRPDWLWIRAGDVALVVAADFPSAPAA